MGIEGHVIEHLLFRDVAEVHIVHGDIALQLRVGDRAVCLMGMAPRPVTGTGFGLGDIASFVDIGVDQCHIALVHLRCLVHQLKDTLGTCQCHDDGIKLVGDLVDGHIEASGQQHKGHQTAKTQHFTAGCHNENAADDGENGVLDITQIVVDGSHGVGKTAGGIGVLAERLIELIKLLLGGFLVGEDLHDLLTVDHFLHIAIESTQRSLLAHKELARLADDLDGYKHDARYREHGHDGQNPGGTNHGDENHQNGDHGREALRNRLGNHLPQGVDVAGEAGHDVAGGVGVEVAQGKTLHFGEHLVTDGFLGALRHADHQKLLQEGCNHTGCEDAGNADQVLKQGREVGGAR